jgi:hypothetical protein
MQASESSGQMGNPLLTSYLYIEASEEGGLF